MDSLLLVFLLSVIACLAQPHPVGAPSDSDTDAEVISALLNGTAKTGGTYQRMPELPVPSIATQPTTKTNQTAAKMVIPEDVELVPPFESKTRDKATTNSLFGVVMNVSIITQHEFNTFLHTPKLRLFFFVPQIPIALISIVGDILKLIIG